MASAERAFGLQSPAQSAKAAPMSQIEPTPAPSTAGPTKFLRYGVILPIFMAALDQLSKWATMQWFKLPMNACAIGDPNMTTELSPIVDLSIICNRGISWGLLQGDSMVKRWVLTVFAFIMAGALMFAVTRTHDNLGKLSLSFLIGGAVGNAIDRLLFGAVTDMINFSDIGFNYVFNVADSFITIGVIGLFLSSWMTERAAKRAAVNQAVK